VDPHPGGCGRLVFGLVVVDRWRSERGSPRRVPGNFDLAAAFGDNLFPEATGANYLIEILPTLF
jgi:hypothetical protein